IRPSKHLASGPNSLLREDLLVTPRNGRTIISMMPRTGRALLRIASPFVVVACSAACLLKAADPASGVTPAADPPAVLPPIAGRSAISPAAPILPGETVAALQDGNHEAACGALVKLRENAKDPDERAYLGYLQGVTERLAGHNDAARATLRAAAAENPTGRWLPKIRFELSAIELAAGNLPVAEELARSEAIRLLSDDRKDRLAEVYHAFARRLLEPDDPVIQPDPKAAWDLLSQARDLAKSPVLRAQLLFAIGRTSRMAGYFPRAIEHFQAYLKEYPGGADRPAARFHLGETQRQYGQPLQARLTWADLVRDIERLKPAAADKDAQSIRAKALVEIPSTFGIPNPPDDTSMNLGVAALQRFLSAYPAHPRAVRAAYQIGATYLARGKSDLALAALSRFLKDDGFKVETDQAR